jgi:hypothetical protein
MNWGRFVKAGVVATSTALMCMTAPPLNHAEAASVQLRYGIDYYGYDIGLHKWVSLNRCQQLCIGTGNCSVFTYDSKNRWCFLKYRAGRSSHVSYAISGLVTR